MCGCGWVCVRERKPRCEGTAISAGSWAWFGNGHEGTARRNGPVFSILFLSRFSRQATGALAWVQGNETAQLIPRPYPHPSHPNQPLLPKHCLPVLQLLTGPRRLAVVRPSDHACSEDAPHQLPNVLVSAIKEGWGPPRAYCGHAPPRLSHYLTQVDGASGEGPDAAKAEGRRVRCARGGGVRQETAVRLSYPGRKGATSQPASQKVPRTPGQVPERQGTRLESHYWFCLSSLRSGEGDGRGVGGGGCVREGAREGRDEEEENVGIGSWFPSLFLCVAVVLGPGTRGVVCMNFLHVHACRSGHRGRPATCGRRLPADSESSESPRIDQPACPASSV